MKELCRVRPPHLVILFIVVAVLDLKDTLALLGAFASLTRGHDYP